MKKRVSTILAVTCYVLGVVASLYVGCWKMIYLPLRDLYEAFGTGAFRFSLVVSCGIKLLLSTTLAGSVWCVGYIGYNYFIGTDDPDWDALEEKGSCRDSKSA